jgi:hypothetical protein
VAVPTSEEVAGLQGRLEELEAKNAALGAELLSARLAAQEADMLKSEKERVSREIQALLDAVKAQIGAALEQVSSKAGKDGQGQDGGGGGASADVLAMLNDLKSSLHTLQAQAAERERAARDAAAAGDGKAGSGISDEELAALRAQNAEARRSLAELQVRL